MALRQFTSLLVFTFVLGAGFSAHSVCAQSEAHDDISVSVSMMAADGPFSELDQQVIEALRKALRSHDLVPREEAQWRYVLLADVKELPDGEQIVLSVTTLVGLPKNVVELASQEEAFYRQASFENDELPTEGEEVREWVSKDWVRNFHQVENQEMRVLQRSELDEASAAIAQEFIRKH